MEKIKIERVITVDVIKFDDGSEIDVDIIEKFLDESCLIIDTVGKYGNYTSEYIYFERNDEKKLEPILLKLDVIRESPNHIKHNDKVNKGLIKRGMFEHYIKYWLSDGYQKFKTDFWNCFK